MNAVVLSLVIGLVVYLLAVRIYRDWLFLSRPRRTALGTVIGHRRLDNEGSQLSLPIVRFDSDADGTIEFTNRWGSWPQELELGLMVAVEYPAGLPQSARIVGSYSPLLAYGLAVTVLALLVAFFFLVPGG
jgi:hypothetical protein